MRSPEAAATAVTAEELAASKVAAFGTAAALGKSAVVETDLAVP